MADEAEILRERKDRIQAGGGLEARSCKKTDCAFHRYVGDGGSPCSGCRRVVLPDYYRAMRG